jgi:hypothetical protein
MVYCFQRSGLQTALALREEMMVVHFTGPVKTATKDFPIEAMRWTLATMARGEHIVLKSMDYENLWAIGWHDKWMGSLLRANPLPKKRQNREGTNYHIPIARPHFSCHF